MITFVTPEEGKNIIHEGFYLGQEVKISTNAYRDPSVGRIVAIDTEDDDRYKFGVLDNDTELVRSTEDFPISNVTALKEVEGYTEFCWFGARDLTPTNSEDIARITKAKAQAIIKERQSTSEGQTIIKALKQIIPKPHTPQLSFQRDQEQPNVKYIIIDNHTTLCIDEFSGTVGISYLHPDDTFNLELAKALAFYRNNHYRTSESLRKGSKRKVF